MSLEQQISKGIMEAMKAKDTVRLSALRNAKKYIIEAKTAGPEIAELPDARSGRFCSEKIAEVGATSMKEMGKVMGVASKRLAGRADGKDISAKVRELLA